MHLRDLTQFLTELEDNNNRPWFIMNKPRYDILREEFLAVVTELIAELGKFDKQVIACNPKKAMFRINRDIRFSNDKRPYKTRFSAGITPKDLRRPSAGGGPTYYFHIGGDGTMFIGAGEYLPPAPRLKMIRDQVVNDATGFARLIKNKGLNATFSGFEQDDKLQRPPKGYDAAHQHIEFLKLKSYFVGAEVKVSLNEPDKLVPQLAAAFKDAYGLVAWLRAVEFPTTED